MLGSEIVEQAGHDLADAPGIADQVILLHDLQVGDGGGEGHRVGVVGEAAVVDVVFPIGGDLVADGDGAERHVGRGEAFGQGHQIGHDAPVIDGEPGASAAQAAHDLVADEQDAVFVADGAQALQVAVGRHDEAVGAGDGLDKDGGDGVRRRTKRGVLPTAL